MSQSEDQLDPFCGGGAGITDLVFGDQNEEKRSWRFCNSRLPRFDLVYFTQISIIVFLSAILLINLVFVLGDESKF